MTCTFYYFREITYYVLVVAKLKISKRQVANLGLLLKARHKPLGLLLGLRFDGDHPMSVEGEWTWL